MNELVKSYPFWLALLSLLVLTAERIAPWRKDQEFLRPFLWSDVLHLVFNGHFLGVVVYGLYSHWIHAPLITWLEGLGVSNTIYAGVAATWPIGVQIVVALFAVDFVQWLVHNLLHRFTPLWQIHKVHHSIVDGEMDFIVSFRFHWLEVVLYKSFLYVPLAFFGFGMEAIFVHAVFGTLIGHLNHSNLKLSYGPLRYLLNSPRMHIWHHDYEGDEKTTKNFGIIFSIWDWIFGTAYMPEEPPAKLGYAGVDRMPKDFFAQALWPISGLMKRGPALGALSSMLGLLLLSGLYMLAQGQSALAGPRAESPSSQPARMSVEEAIHAPEAARPALAKLGTAAKAAGYAHPEWLASAEEVSQALGAPELVLIDVRPKERYAEGHLPTAKNVTREDYSVSTPVPGLSRDAEALRSMLEARGVSAKSTLVLYGDGGAEPYRLWWTLKEVLGFEARIMDGGVQAWKKLLLPTDTRAEVASSVGRLPQTTAKRPRLEHWPEVEARLRQAHPESGAEVLLIDTRTAQEYRGEKQDKNAARAGRIPGALHLSWADFLVSLDDPRLRPVEELKTLLAAHSIGPRDSVVAYCQSATRSAVLVFALLQLGHDEDRIDNYGGSWAEYSRLDAPLETGPN